MRRNPIVPLTAAWALALGIVSSASRQAAAQEIVELAVPQQHVGHQHKRWFHHSEPVFPRTFSYQYDIWFNRPRHTRSVTPDGRVVWHTTVRGLPMGTPSPAY